MQADAKRAEHNGRGVAKQIHEIATGRHQPVRLSGATPEERDLIVSET